MRDALLRAFRRAFPDIEPTHISRAPGRVNLLGAHTDYNEGYVLPVAIDRAVYVVAAASDEPLLELVAADIGERVAVRLADLEAGHDVEGSPLPRWARYPVGVAWALLGRGLAVWGIRAVFGGDVPIGSGLSSSAAVEVAFAALWQEIGGWELPSSELAKLARLAENEYVGVGCGIMDQFASVHGRAGHAILLDSRSLEWESVPLPPGTIIVVADTRTHHELASSEYNTRVRQCHEAVRRLSERLPGIRALRDLTPEALERNRDLLDDTLYARARHVVDENRRVLEAVEALRRGDAATVGDLMKRSHISSRDLYETSCEELDAMWEAAIEHPACYGARLTGAGFGGATVNLVLAEGLDDFVAHIRARYRGKTGIEPAIIPVESADGAWASAL